MIKWIKTLFRIVKIYDKEYKNLWNKTDSALASALHTKNVIKSRTSINADIAVHHKTNTIIVIGNYNKMGYIETFQMDGDNFGKIVDTMREMKKYGIIDNIDSLPHMRHVFNKEKF